MLQKSEWVQVVHTYNGQNGRVYVNGRLDLPAAMPSTMQILTPVRMEIGGGFFGDIDEVRISKWARSADWVKLQYENQKPLQTAGRTAGAAGQRFLGLGEEYHPIGRQEHHGYGQGGRRTEDLLDHQERRIGNDCRC